MAYDEKFAARIRKGLGKRKGLVAKQMKGWILVAPKGIATDAQLKQWISIAATYAGALPPKK